MSVSRRSLIAGIASASVVPAAQGASPDVVTVRTVPSVAGWPNWTLLDPTAAIPLEFRITADSLQFLEPAPGYRFREDGAGIIIHEPDPTLNQR
jgi:hypothetical protein